MNKKVIIIFAAVAVLAAGVAGGAVWFMSKGGEERSRNQGRQGRKKNRPRRKRKSRNCRRST
jgi:flagellar FliL protein